MNADRGSEANHPRSVLVARRLMLCVVFAFVLVAALAAGPADAQEAFGSEPSLMLEDVGRSDKLVVDATGRPVWYVTDYPYRSRSGTLRRCADAVCSSIEESRVTDFVVTELLVDGDTIVMIGKVIEGQVPDEPQFVVRRCADGPAGFCDPATTEEHRVLRSALGQNYDPRQAKLNSDGHPVLLADDNSIVSCTDPLCTTLAGSPVQVFSVGPFVYSSGQQLLVTPEGLPFVAFTVRSSGPSNPSLFVVECRDLRCEDRNVNQHDPDALGLPADSTSLSIRGGAVAPGDGARPVFAVSGGGETRVVDCRTFVCSAPQTNPLDLEGAAWRMTVNDLGNLVFFGRGFLTLCGDDRCQVQVATEPVAASPTYGDSIALSMTPDGRPVVLGGGALVICSARDCPRPDVAGPVLFSRVECAEDDHVPDAAIVQVQYMNLSEQEGVFELRTGSVRRSVVVPGRQTGDEIEYRDYVTGRPDGPLAVVISLDGVDFKSRAVAVACDALPKPLARATCMNGTGRIDVLVERPLDQAPRTFAVDVGAVTRMVTLTEERAENTLNRFADTHRIGLATVSSRPDGTYAVVVTDQSTGAEVHRQTVDVACASDSPPPMVGSHSIVVSCLQNNGRIDTTVVERSGDAAVWTVEVEGLSPRQATVASGDWWRMPVTGRPDSYYTVAIKRNGVGFAAERVRVWCDEGRQQVLSPEVTVTNACRAGRGYLLYQFVNQGVEPASWVLEFQGVPNRSTSAAGGATSVKAVTGRPNGTYDWTLRGGRSGQVVVNC